MASKFQNDEALARQLQAQFDAEDITNRNREDKDWELAMSYSKAHTMSDSDSDATIDPDDLGYKNSPDLFDVEESDKHFERSFAKSNPSTSKRKEESINKPKLQQRHSSKNHNISDSDSDCDVKLSKGKGKGLVSVSSPIVKKRKHDNDGASPVKKRKSLTNSFQKEEHRSPNKLKSSSSKKEELLSFIREKSKDSEHSSPSLKKIASVHTVSDSESDDDHKPSSLNRNKSNSSSSKHSPVKTNKTIKSGKEQDRPMCKYGKECLRKNPSHFEEFKHEVIESTSVSKAKKTPSKYVPNRNIRKSGKEIFEENQPLSFYMTKVTGIDDVHNMYGAIGIKDILSPSMGNLEASCQFNYMFEVDWLVKQYPEQFRNKPLTLVHGEQRGGLATLLATCAPYSNITCCQAKLEIMYGTHHTKMMLLLYDSGMRVVIHTSNLIERDWYQKSQGVWVSPVFPKLPADASPSDKKLIGDSPTHFKRDLLAYLAAYRAHKLTVWEKHIRAHDMSTARVHIIGSVPGRHTGEQKNMWGHFKLRKTLQKHGPEPSQVKSWPLIGQFSSIGSLGPTPDNWVFKEWLQSLSATRGLSSLGPSSKITLVFPSVDNVRVSLEGYPGGTSIPYSINTAKKQVYIHQHMRQWKSEGRGRSRVCPHIKTYLRPSPDSSKTAWFLVTSANLSKAAWGALEKNGSQLMIRSYEIGVLFLPSDFGCESFPVTSDPKEAISRSDEPVFPLPYDLPLTPYNKGDRPWMVDIPCMHAPDTNGNMWCPPL